MAPVQRIFSYNSSRSNISRFAIILGVAASLGGCLGYDGVLTRGAVTVSYTHLTLPTILRV